MEFYIKHIGDPNYQTKRVQSTGEIEQLLTQIETTLFTRKRDVLGEPNFGCNLEDLVYGLNQSEFQIRNEIESQLMNYVPLAQKYSTEVDVKFFKGEVRDICYVDITVNNEYIIQVNLR
jgi:phage baseplate assembly protein W